MKWICSQCAANRGLKLAHDVTWHAGLCEVCRTPQSVADVLKFYHHTGADLPVDRGAKP